MCVKNKDAEEEAQTEGESRELEWLIATDDGYKWNGHHLEARGGLQNLLERDGAKEHQQDDGSYILSYFPQGLYDDAIDQIKYQIKILED